MAQCGIHIFVGKDAQQHANVSEERGDDNTLDDDQLEDVPRSRTDGFADAKLVGTLLHSDEHDVRYAHDTREQRKQTDHPKEGVDNGDGLFHLHALCIAVPDPDTTLIIRMGLMIGVQTTTVGLFKVLVGLLCRQTVEGKLDVSQIIGIGTIDALNG